MKNPQQMGAFRNGIEDRRPHDTQSEVALQVHCILFREFRRNTLLGFASFVVEPFGLVIEGCNAHEKDGERWVNLPSRQYKDEAGVTQWQPLIRFERKSSYWRFQSLALAAIDEFLAESGVEVRKVEHRPAKPAPLGLTRNSVSEDVPDGLPF